MSTGTTTTPANDTRSGFDFSYQTVINGLLREAGDWERIELKAREPETPRVQELLDALPEEFDAATLTDLVRIPLTGVNAEVVVGVRYWSLTGRHQFQLPALRRDLATGASGGFTCMDLEQFLRDCLSEVSRKLQVAREPEPEQMLEKIVNSRDNIARFIEERADDLDQITGAAPLSFAESEQALLVGHMTHPTAKSREGFSHEEMKLYSPELQGRFALHYFRVHPELAHHGSAVSDKSGPDLIKDMLRADPQVSAEIKELLDAPRMILPVHPWQAEYVKTLEPVAQLLKDGLLEDLGVLGSPTWTATTSVRTVYSEDFDYMLKFSLNIKITNSVRVNLTRELDRSVEMASLMQTPYGRGIQADVPNFFFIQDPAYVAVKWGGKVIEPLSCTLREAKFTRATDGRGSPKMRDITAITCLVQDHPLGHDHRNRLYNIIADIAEREDRDLHAAGLEWFRRYLDVSIYNLFKLYFRHGLCFEAHGQNSLLELENGYPVKYLYRDSQGYFHRQASHEDFCRAIPALGEKTESIFPEDLANERLVYYLIINQVFSVINALGTQGILSEAECLREFAVVMERVRNEPNRYPLDMITHLQSNERLPCKSNLLTQYFNMDELVGDIATQSVYVDIANVIKPFAQELKEARREGLQQ